MAKTSIVDQAIKAAYSGRKTTLRRSKKDATSSTTTPSMESINPDKALKTKYNKRIKISPETLQPLFTVEQKSEPIKKLIQNISARIKDGRTMNFKSYRIWAAIDQAYEAPFNQITPTLVGSILAKNLNPDQILKELQVWGISEDTLFSEIEVDALATAGNATTSPTGKKTKVKILNEQTFFKTLVPLVKSYITIRLAKLYNDRNQYPFLKYEPFRFTEVNRVICEILTDQVQKMTQQYGFQSVLRQAILQALMYSMALVFPMEAWSYEMDVNDKGEEYAKREGLRYNIPHPSQMFFDQNFRTSSFNTDTGCTFAGYWNVMRYGDVESNSLYWNKQVIPYGTNWMSSTISGPYFTELYPCVLRGPWPDAKVKLSPAEEAARYTTNDYDKAVFVTNYFAKLKPKDWGLGDWKYETWFRFIVASDDTIIFAEPLPYCPVLYLGYESDENRVRNPSMALEIIPWQDHLGNVISQILLSAKQNLAKIVYYDTEQVDEKTIRDLKTQSKDSSGILFVPFSSKRSKMAGVDMARMFVPIQFPLQDTVALTNVIGTVISIMERLLGMSSSEVGAAGSHVQTAEEIRVISSNTSTRVEYTGAFVDEFIDAWKKQIYYASQSFMDEEFVTEVSAVEPDAVKALEKVGFKMGETFNGRTEISGDKSMLAIEAFVSNRDGQNRINAPQIAQVMMQTIQAVAANETLSQLIGPDQIMESLNRAAQLAGAPKDFRFKPDPQAKMQQSLMALQEQLTGIAKQIQQGAVQQTMQAAQPLADQVKEQTAAIDAISKETGNQSKAVQMINQQVQQLQAIVGAALQALQAPRPVSVDMSMAA